MQISTAKLSESWEGDGQEKYGLRAKPFSCKEDAKQKAVYRSYKRTGCDSYRYPIQRMDAGQ